jgi:hypothetical protein
MMLEYLDCARKFGFEYVSGYERPDNQHAALGFIFHLFTKLSYRQTKKGYYSEIVGVKPAQAAWERFFPEQLKTKYPEYAEQSKISNEMYNKGKACVTTYFGQMRGRPEPIQIEKTYWHVLNGPNVMLRTVFDQVHEGSISDIAKVRPELIRGGKLDSAYIPWIIKDLKTTRYKEAENSWNKFPWPAIPDLQALLEVWLVKQWTGKMPVGFVFDYLLDTQKNKRFVKVEEKDFLALEHLVKSMVASLNTKSFSQKGPADIWKCKKFCPFYERCKIDKEKPEPKRKFEAQTEFNLKFE